MDDEFWDDEDDFVMNAVESSKPSWWNLLGAGIRLTENLVGDSAMFLHKLADMTLAKHVEASERKMFVQDASRSIETITAVSEKDSL
jgi:hypothetical protein